MKWIKASKRLPEKAKDLSVDTGVIFRKIYRTNTFVCHTSIRSFSFMGQNLEEWEWLDETESPDSEAVELLTEVRQRLLIDLDDNGEPRSSMADLMQMWDKVNKVLNLKYFIIPNIPQP